MARESSVTHKSVITDHVVEENHIIDWDKAQRQTRWIKEAFWITKTPICMNRDVGSYQLSHTWDQVISKSRAPSSCKLSRRDQEMLSLGNILQLCRARSFYIIVRGVVTSLDGLSQNFYERSGNQPEDIKNQKWWLFFWYWLMRVVVEKSHKMVVICCFSGICIMFVASCFYSTYYSLQ